MPPRRSSRRSTGVASSAAPLDTSVVDSVYSVDGNNLSISRAYSTFCEPSSLEDDPSRKFLKPKFVMPRNFFPGDDIDEDIPWIGETYSAFYPDKIYNGFHETTRSLCELPFRMYDFKQEK